MSYAALAQAAIQVGGALLANKNQKDLASIGAALNAQQALAANLTADTRLVRERERASTSRFIQQLNNQRRAEQQAQRNASAKGALFRAQEAQASNTAQGRLSIAQASGEAAAQAAFQGITETGPGLVESSLALREARGVELAQRQVQQRQFLLGEQIAASAGEIQMADMRPIFADVNYDRAVPQGARPVRSTADVLLNATDWMQVGNAFADVYTNWSKKNAPPVDQRTGNAYDPSDISRDH